MNEKLVNQSQLAKELGVTRGYISQLVKAGRFDTCFDPTGKKIMLKKALVKYSTELQIHRKKSKKLPKEYKPTKKEPKIDSKIYNTDNKAELAALIGSAESPMHKINIESTFWQAKTRRLSFMEAEGELIPLADAKAAVEEIFTPINTKFNDMPVQFKAHFPEVSTEAVEWLDNFVNEVKVASEAEWGDL